MEQLDFTRVIKFKFTPEEIADYDDSLTIEEEHQQLIYEETKKLKIYKCYKWIYPMYRDVYPEDSDTASIGELALKYSTRLKQAVKNNQSIPGLLITGDCSCGKTYLARMIANESARNMVETAMINWSTALDEFSQFDCDPSFKEMIATIDLLVIDDFGANRLTDYQIERMYMLIDSRYLSGKTTVFTSNLTYKDLTEEKSLRLRRIYQRIIEMTAHFELNSSLNRRETTSKANKQEILELLKF